MMLQLQPLPGSIVRGDSNEHSGECADRVARFSIHCRRKRDEKDRSNPNSLEPKAAGGVRDQMQLTFLKDPVYSKAEQCFLKDRSRMAVEAGLWASRPWAQVLP